MSASMPSGYLRQPSIPKRPLTRSVRATARIVGTLFLAGFLTYGIGNAIATNLAGSVDQSSRAMLVVGAALMLTNSFVVIGIGVLMLPILQPHSKAVALGYLATRIFEGIGLAVGVGCLLLLNGSAAISGNFIAYNVAMSGLGIGSLFFCAVLFRSGLTPRFLAGWGFVGYAFFAAGSLLELLGVKGAGLVGAVPGGLFEVVFGIWLIARGFRHAGTVVDGGPIHRRIA
ncbi:hypothetical protein QF031_002100 [Pseudarthrobacter defluvii]|uniref:DUF4386 domain-containing protein n=1 Tax=Pseudarthrobacter defluvii TaxID=410837 RepID=UPI002780E79A|nr:DUF4386 domain-containing protein [Pseudarthrobacter defluvii]MDQ0769351.1 hypothetical protein [Pseudarthrobacter defluvii]